MPLSYHSEIETLVDIKDRDDMIINCKEILHNKI